jgi:hypothetical protein
MTEITKDLPRRIRIDLMTPAELAITNAMHEVEIAGASIELTNAVIKLMEARNLVADHVDNKLQELNSKTKDSFGGVMLSLKRDSSITNSKIVLQKNKYK